jgi:hypothetical protein
MLSTLATRATRQPAVHDRPQRRFRVGRDREGRWVAVETSGASGGIFKSRDAALRYPASETGRRPGAIAVWPEPLELKI